ncbi:PTS sugar transporter subunit IIA [Thermococcus sp. EP1]|uniref:PTS sugar transporter subunit IIA n=1 Tax=Thermococcus sp. EP1 TaxID=1591054 RepID=UPI0006DD2262|nr:PTS sugar transporter subunit IIA [Thermococcus sp. EP1]
MIETICLEDIKTNVEVATWEESVKVAGEILYKNGKITKDYILGMIETIKKLGPYAVIAPGIALPHARPEDGALKVGISIVVLNNPINFGSPNDPVKVVIAFSAPDKTSHVQLLQELAKLLSDEEIRGKLANAKTPQEVVEIIESFKSERSEERN